MGSYTFKIGSTTVDLGITKSIVIKRITWKFPMPPIDETGTVEMINMGKTYLEITITGRYNDTEDNINNFINAINVSELYLSQCYLTSRFTGIINNFACVITGFDYNDDGGSPGYIDYTLVLTEAIPVT